MIKKIRTEDLEVGMFVSDFNAPWVQHPFLTRTKRIRSAREIQIILDNGIHEVYIDTAKGKDSPKACLQEEADGELKRRMHRALEEPEPSAPSSEGEPEPEPEETPFEEEVRRAQEVFQEARGFVRRLFEDVRLGKSVDGEAARETVQGMIGSIFRNRDALLSLARIKSRDDYTFQHSVNVAVLVLSLGSHLGILHRELLHLGIGAILHDLGKVCIPDEILRKEGALNPQEFELAKSHTAHGARLLMAAESVPEACAPVALNHHEHYDGTGYPRRLSGMDAGKFGLITAIADAYDAMTSDRVYQRGMPPHQAVQRCYGWAGSRYHPIYTKKFIQCLGIYPVGTVVCLDTGEVGVVCRQNRGQLLQPWVRLVRTSAGAPLPEPLDVDLKAPDPAGAKLFARAIVAVLEPADAGFEVEPYLLLRAARAVGPEEKITVTLG